MRMHRVTSIVALTLAASVAILHGYTLNGPKWAVKQVPYYVNPLNADVADDAAIAAIQAGAMTWSAQSNASISWYYMGRTTGSSLTKNLKNEIFFRNESDGSVIARTYWWYNGSNELIDADIVFYDGGWTFFTGSAGCSDGVYIEDIAAHEFGHALGLGHSSESAATMYPSVSRCSTAFRTLDSDDLAGVETLYPPTTPNATPIVSIGAPSNNASYTEGASVSFSGTASDAEEGNLSGRLVWTSSRDGQIGTGASVSRALSVGTHTVTAMVSDSSGQTSSSQVSVIVEAIVTNQPPAVSISTPANNTSVLEGSSVTFSGSASDSEDGNLTSKLVWTSSLDGPMGIGGSVSKALSAGTHTIRATVTDTSGAASYKQVAVTVAAVTAPTPPPPPSSFWLTAKAVKKKGLQQTELRWGGDSSASVDIYRDGVRVTTTPNDGSHVDALNRRGSGSYSYKVCAAGTSTCSNAAGIRF
jgi:hypothetical protein